MRRVTARCWPRRYADLIIAPRRGADRTNAVDHARRSGEAGDMSGAGTGAGEGLADVGLGGGSHSEAVRVGDTVRRRPGPWSAGVLDLLRHLERAGFDGAPRTRGFDDRGREVVTYVDGEVGAPLPDVDAGPLDDA